MWIRGLVSLALFLSSVSELIDSVHSVDSGPCKIVDGEDEYDLSELSYRDYWRYFETFYTARPTKVYYLSVCHALRNVPSCVGSNSGICSVQASDSSNTSHVYQNLGEVPSTFKVADAGRIEYIYDSGEKCTSTGRDANFTTEIHMVCPQRSETPATEGPELLTAAGCNIFFAWLTEAACPKKLEPNNVTACITKFPNSNHTLNLHTLHSSSYYNVTSHDENYEVNICGPVTNGHCGKEDATVCKLNPSTGPVVMGTTENMELMWSNNHFKLTYKYNSKIFEIQLYCDRKATSPQIYFDSPGVFMVKTVAVCKPDVPQCVISDRKGNVFDLGPLHKEVGNWKVVDRREGQTVWCFFTLMFFC